MNTGTAEAKVARVAVAFTSFLGTFDGRVCALGKKPAAFANAWSVMEKSRKESKKRGWRIGFTLFFIA